MKKLTMTNPGMPSITFGEDTDLDSFFALLYWANEGLRLRGKWEPADGLTFAFHFTSPEGDEQIVGSYHGSDGDSIQIAVHEAGSPTGEVVTRSTMALRTAIYL